MSKITIDESAVSPVDGADNKLVTEASTIGLAPGQWPTAIEVGVGRTFYLQGVTTREGDVLLATYTTANGRVVLTVLND